MNPSFVSKKVSINALALRLVIEALMSHPHTYDDLTEVTGLHHNTLIRWLAPWRKRIDDMPRRVRIASWEPDPRGYHTRPAFAWGSERDAPRPKLTGAQRQQRVRDRKKAMALQNAVHQISRQA